MSDDANKQLDPPPLITTSGLQVAAPHGRFEQGHAPLPGSGRPKGSRNRIKADLSHLILDAAAMAGFMTVDDKGKPIPGPCQAHLCLACSRSNAGTVGRDNHGDEGFSIHGRGIAPKRPGSSHFPQPWSPQGLARSCRLVAADPRHTGSRNGRAGGAPAGGGTARKNGNANGTDVPVVARLLLPCAWHTGSLQ
jgi:hypothetical protein